MSIAFVEPTPTLPPRTKAARASCDHDGASPQPPSQPSPAAPAGHGHGEAAFRPTPLAETATQAVIEQALRQLRGGRVAEAHEALRQLARLEPAHAGVRVHLGLALRQLGRLDEAVHELEQATRLAPGEAGYHHQLGLTCRMLGRLEDARTAFERAIEIDAAHAGALIGLGLLHDRHFDEPALAAPLYLRGAALLPAEAAMIHRWLNDVMRRCARVSPPGGSPAAAGFSSGRRGS